LINPVSDKEGKLIILPGADLGGLKKIYLANNGRSNTYKIVRMTVQS
jgi:hypothetical protein